MTHPFYKKFSNLGRRIKKEGSTKIKRQIVVFISGQKHQAKKIGCETGLKRGRLLGIKEENKRILDILSKMVKQNDKTYLTTGYNIAINEVKKHAKTRSKNRQI